MNEFANFEPIISIANRDALQYYQDKKIQFPNNSYFNDYFKVPEEPKEEIPFMKEMNEKHPLFNKSVTMSIPYPNFEDSNIKIGDNARIAKVHNNPGNLMYIGQKSAEQGEPKSGGGFWAKFNSPKEGYLAVFRDIESKKAGKTKTGLHGNSTLSDLINIYAPKFENDTNSYVKHIVDSLGIPHNTPIKNIGTKKLVDAIVKIESSTVVK